MKGLENIHIEGENIVKIDNVSLVARQLKGYPRSIIEAAVSGYYAGYTYKKFKLRLNPYEKTTREYTFWCHGFDYGIQDAKLVHQEPEYNTEDYASED
jgi:hypothetical protein